MRQETFSITPAVGRTTLDGGREMNRFVAVAAVVSVVLGGCRPGRSDAGTASATPSEQPQPTGAVSLPVVGDAVRLGDLVLSVTTTGTVRAESMSRLKAETSGTVEKVLVAPGQQVRKGDVLVRLDPRPFDLAVDEAQAGVATAQVAYNDVVIPDSLLTGHAPSDERKENTLARSGLLAARVRLARAKLERERATIAAPFDGVVEAVNVSPGERLNAGQDIASVVDLAHLRVEAQVLEHDLPLVKVGGLAVVSSAALNGRVIRGTVSAVLPVVDSATRAGRAVIRVNGDGTLRPGMYADVKLEATRLGRRIMVPARAVIERDGRPLVFVVKRGRAQWTYVTPGRSNGAETEILPDSASGQVPVAVGDTVLIDGHVTLTHDAPVKVVARTAKAP